MRQHPDLLQVAEPSGQGVVRDAERVTKLLISVASGQRLVQSDTPSRCGRGGEYGGFADVQAERICYFA